MATLIERISEVLESGAFGSAREWCRKAGVSENYIGALKSRTSTGEVKQGKSEEIGKLAKAANVSVEWLMGADAPAQAPRHAEAEDRYVAMPAVRAMARAQGFAEEFVAKWEVHLDADDQPDADYLWTLCKADYARWSRKEKVGAGGDPLADLDGPRMRPTRKKS